MAGERDRAALARAAIRLSAASRAGLPPLVLFTDDERLPDPLRAVRALPKGSMVVVRSREAEQAAQLATEIVAIAHVRALKVLIAADAALAIRVGADGLHLPGMQVAEAARWRARRPDWLITAATHNTRAVLRAAFLQLDAIFLSPVFATQSHVGRAAMGNVRLRLIARASRVPVYALGGIDALTARRLHGAPLCGLAAIGALAA